MGGDTAVRAVVTVTGPQGVPPLAWPVGVTYLRAKRAGDSSVLTMGLTLGGLRAALRWLLMVATVVVEPKAVGYVWNAPPVSPALSPVVLPGVAG